LGLDVTLEGLWDAAPVDLPPGPSRARMAQMLVAWIRDPASVLDRCSREYGDPFTLPLGGMPPFVVVSDPDAVRDIFRGDPRVFLSGQANAALQAALGRRSLLILDRQEHLRERKMLLPPFHGERMRAYGDLMTAVAERSLAGWPRDVPFPVAPRTRAIALEVIMRAVFGVDDDRRLDRLERSLSTFLDNATKPYRVLTLFLMRPGGPTMRFWQRFNRELRPVDRMLLEEIRLRRAQPGGHDILSMLVEARDPEGRPLSDDHLRDELMTLLVAGHETTATALAWALLRLVQAPVALERAAEDDDYLDAVIHETLRLHPVTPFSSVRDTTEPVEVGGRRYPAGVRFAVSSHLLHRRPDVYPDPERFDPDRFVGVKPGTYTWIPFGGGTRRCLGASFALFEMRAVLRAILRAGPIHAAGPELEGDARRGITMTPNRGARIVVGTPVVREALDPVEHV
jgi:cytochrome P450